MTRQKEKKKKKKKKGWLGLTHLPTPATNLHFPVDGVLPWIRLHDRTSVSRAIGLAAPVHCRHLPASAVYRCLDPPSLIPRRLFTCWLLPVLSRRAPCLPLSPSDPCVCVRSPTTFPQPPVPDAAVHGSLAANEFRVCLDAVAAVTTRVYICRLWGLMQVASSLVCSG